MIVSALRAPGRFPTVAHDIGPWWSSVSGQDFERDAFDLNTRFWRLLCSPWAIKLVWSHLPTTVSVRRRLELGAQGIDATKSGIDAGDALNALQQAETFRSTSAYCNALGAIAGQLELLNQIQGECRFSFVQGVEWIGADYSSSKSLEDCASKTSLLTRLIRAALKDFRTDTSLAVFNVGSPEELLTALIATTEIRRIAPRAHLCLGDHSYENYSLQAYLPALKARAAFLGFFDTVVETRPERDRALSRIVTALRNGQPLRGYLNGTARDKGSPIRVSPPGIAPLSPPGFESFSPRPVRWTRISANRCYWNRCTFCAQNAKHVGMPAPDKSEVALAIASLRPVVESGIRDFIFSDEALSPAMLRTLANAIIASRLKFNWACRSKVELALNRDLFALLRRAGCYEILFGIESTSPRMLERMGKTTPGADTAFLARMFADMHAEGIVPHISLIVGFPGDTLPEAEDSVEFTAGILASVPGSTWTLNRFALFPDTPVQQNPELFGIQLHAETADMPPGLRYDLDSAIAASTLLALNAVPRLEKRLMSACGLDALVQSESGRLAASLYLGSGHGGLMKSSAWLFARPAPECEFS